jgi:hypothetical protein
VRQVDGVSLSGDQKAQRSICSPFLTYRRRRHPPESAANILSDLRSGNRVPATAHSRHCDSFRFAVE